MIWVLATVTMVVLGLTAVVASGRWGQMPELVDDRPLPRLASVTGVLAGEDLRGARFSVVARGYSPAQVDELLDRLADQLDRADGAAPSDQRPEAKAQVTTVLDDADRVQP
ncbi:MAG TPA: DivIVA domain-containing protein [Candidatus Luteococcus avicola]|nr:DivIVA domain-containing protein [Candidatus Luteococcus avicola]